jgi:hypothetical protein
MATANEIQEFVTLCVPLTGFAEYDLHGTGMAGLYLDTARRQVGALPFQAFLTAWKQAVAQHKGPGALTPVNREVARAVTYLWYTGAWPRIAPAAHAELRRQMANTEFVASPEAYAEGLVWRAFGAHPAGAKPPGFGTWSMKPAPLPGVEEIRSAIGVAEGTYRTAVSEELSIADLPPYLLPGRAPARDCAPSAVPRAGDAQEPHTAGSQQNGDEQNGGTTA